MITICNRRNKTSLIQKRLPAKSLALPFGQVLVTRIEIPLEMEKPDRRWTVEGRKI